MAEGSHVRLTTWHATGLQTVGRRWPCTRPWPPTCACRRFPPVPAPVPHPVPLLQLHPPPCTWIDVAMSAILNCGRQGRQRAGQTPRQQHRCESRRRWLLSHHAPPSPRAAAPCHSPHRSSSFQDDLLMCPPPPDHAPLPLLSCSMPQAHLLKRRSLSCSCAHLLFMRRSPSCPCSPCRRPTCEAWKLAMGEPNCCRAAAYSRAVSRQNCAPPTLQRGGGGGERRGGRAGGREGGGGREGRGEGGQGGVSRRGRGSHRQQHRREAAQRRQRGSTGRQARVCTLHNTSRQAGPLPLPMPCPVCPAPPRRPATQGPHPGTCTRQC